VKTAPTPATVRINRYLSTCGVASRRKAEALVLGGRVRVNGRVVTDLATKIDPAHDRVTLDDRQVAVVHDPLYLVLNKPKDTITTAADERGRHTVMELVRTKQRVYPVGRLDRNTTGVLLLTNDGDFANHLMHPRHHVPKSYHVTLDKAVAREHLQALAAGVRLPDGPTGPADLVAIPGSKGKEVGITIREGRNREVRRMFEHFKYVVTKMDRVAYGPVTKEGLPRGAMRKLTAAEIRALRQLSGMEEKNGRP
jgi:23S rRNA pseudouridine2605 synthase